MVDALSPRRRWEIAENLHRADLTVIQRDEHVAEWIKLTDEAAVSPQVVAKPKKSGRPESGVRAAARDLGVNREEARRAVKVASLTPEAKEVAREVGLDDNRSALLKAAKAAPALQAQVIRNLAGSRNPDIQLRGPD